MKLSDNEIHGLVKNAQNGDSAAMDSLLNLLKGRVKYRSRAYFLVGGDTEDLVQEGMIGLYEAIRDYRPDKGRFLSFAALCIERQLSSAVKKSLREKHRPLNEYISLHYPDHDKSGLIDRLEDNRSKNPQDIMVDKEEYDSLRTLIDKRFSALEKKVLGLFLQGHSYQEIAQKINKTQKSVDNAIQRIRKKLSSAHNGEKNLK